MSTRPGLHRGVGAAGNVVSMVAWIHLYVVGMLAAWVGVVVLVTGWDPVVITSGSMSPTLRPGDVLVVDEHPADELVGQRSVITFRSAADDQELITHRVAEVLSNDRVYITQGDANPTRDSDPVTVDRVEGVGRLVVPLIGLPVVWATEGNMVPLVAVAVLTLAAALIAAKSLALTRRQRDDRRGSPLADKAVRRVRVLVGLMIVSQYFLDGGRFEVQVFGLSPLQLMILTTAGLAAINVVSTKTSTREARSGALDVFELVADTALVVVLITATGGGGIGWVLIALPIIEAAVRFRLAGALMHWMAMAAVTLSLRLWVLNRLDASITEVIAELEKVLDQLGVLLLVAIPGAYLAEQLLGDVVTQRRATDDAVERGRLLEQVAQVGQTINRIGTELFDSLMGAVATLGFSTADVHVRLPDGSWKLLAAHDGDLTLPPAGATGSGLRDEDLEEAEVLVDQDDPDLAEFVPLAASGLRRLVRLTLSNQDGAFIVLRAGQGREDPETAGSVEALRLLCAQATVALQNNQLMTELHTMHQELAHQATHDALTSLPNRALFMDELGRRLAAATDPKRRHIVLFLDLNGFKAVNDTLGHEAGDELLQQVAGRLTDTIGNAGMVARLGGDEFTVLLNPVSSPNAAREVASQIHRALLEPFTVVGKTANVGTSVGIAHPEPGVTESELLRRADAAMYAAKAAGGARTEWYHPRLDEGERRRGRMAAEFKKALERDELALHYQPIVQAATGRIVGAEALLRWQHRELGAVNTAAILELAEVSGRVEQLNRWIFANAADALATCRVAPHLQFDLAVNVSPAELASASVVGNLSDAILLSQVDPGRIIVELSERMVTEDPTTRRHIDEISALGVQLALDDFGEGRTSLAHLRGLPIDLIKLDRVIVDHAVASETDRIILESVTGLAHDLQMNVVAEGIETPDHQAVAEQAGADLLQGYGLYRPMPLHQLQTLLQRFGMVQTVATSASASTAESTGTPTTGEVATAASPRATQTLEEVT